MSESPSRWSWLQSLPCLRLPWCTLGLPQCIISLQSISLSGPPGTTPAGAPGSRVTGDKHHHEMPVTPLVRWVAFGLLLLLASIEAGCYVYAPGPPGPPPPPGYSAVWVPG